MKILAVIFCLLIMASLALADVAFDSDNDGLPDEAEIKIYHTDPYKADTDGDGYNDGQEVKNGYSPLNPGKLKMNQNDFDKDGLNDEMEIKFKTDLAKPDTDGDSYKDGEEINRGYDPLNPKPGVKLVKRLEINLKNQKLSYYLSDVKLGEFPVSHGCIRLGIGPAKLIYDWAEKGTSVLIN